MVDRRTEPVQRFEMFGHAVAHVPFEAIARMRGAKAGHQPVARDLGDNRSGGDRGDQTVAADNGLTIAAGIDAIAAIDKDERRLHRQRRHRPRQRP